MQIPFAQEIRLERDTHEERDTLNGKFIRQSDGRCDRAYGNRVHVAVKVFTLTRIERLRGNKRMAKRGDWRGGRARDRSPQSIGANCRKESCKIRGHC